MGISGKPSVQNFTLSLKTQVPGGTLFHPFLYTPHCPVYLLGRDLLCRVEAVICCATEVGNPELQAPQYPLVPAPDPNPDPADVHWLRLVGGDYTLWREWILSQGTYYEPTDPPHTTLAVLHEPDELYTDLWDRTMDQTLQPCAHQDIYIGPEGVAAHALLDANLLPWYRVPGAASHLTQAVTCHYQPANLGPMMKEAHEAPGS